ncbi:MAG TPA: FHA domain-containing protein [Pyrinomonadaceae bacterium]
MITCDRCKTENLDGSQYCDECGAPLRPNGRPASQPNAGSKSPSDYQPPSGYQPPSNYQSQGGYQPPSGNQPPSAQGHNGNNGASQCTKPEFAGRRVSAGLSFSSLRQPNKPHARLVIEKGRSSGKQFMLSDTEAQIGRWDADGGIFPDVDLDTDDPEAKVSRRHARITLNNGQYFLEDLGSTNGTFINRGKRLPPGQRQVLCDGDEIIVGKTFLRFHIVK